MAYLYYYGLSGVNSLTELMKYVLYFAKELVADKDKFDVFNCLTIMENNSQMRKPGSSELEETILQALKFGQGDGVLNYYFYNYQLAQNKGQLNVSALSHSPRFREANSESYWCDL